MTNLIKFRSKWLCISILLSINTASYAGITNNNAFLYGSGVELGIGSDGAFGSNVNSPEGFFVGKPLGFISDKDLDGFDNGYTGDYFLPGSPEEGWGVSINGSIYNNNNTIQSSQIGGINSMDGQFSDFIDASSYQSVKWTGKVEDLLIVKRYLIYKKGPVIFIDVKVTNTSSAAIDRVQYMRTVDPDNNVNNALNPTGTYATTNTVVSQGEEGVAYVKATQNDGSEISLVGYSSKARVTFGGTQNRNPADVLAGSGGLSASGTNTADEAISLAFDLGKVEAGQEVNFKYSYHLYEYDALGLYADSSKTGDERFKHSDLYEWLASNNASNQIPIIANSTALESTGTIKELSVIFERSRPGDRLHYPDSLPDGITLDASRSSETELTFMGEKAADEYINFLKQLRYSHQADTPLLGRRELNVYMVDDKFVSSNQLETYIDVTVPIAIDAPILQDDQISKSELEQVYFTGSSAPSAQLVITITDSSGASIEESLQSDANGQWRLDLLADTVSSLKDGNLTIQAKAVDENDIETTTNAALVKITEMKPVDISSLSVTDDLIVRSEIEPFSLQGKGEPDGTIAIELEDEAGNKVNVSTDVGADGNWSINPIDIAALEDGDIRTTLRQSDDVGNQLDYSFNWKKDTETLLTLSSDPVSDDHVVTAVDQDKVIIKGTGEPGATVNVVLMDIDNKEVTAQTTVDTEGKWILSTTGVDASSLKDGNIDYRASAIDENGNTAEVSASVPFLKDTRVISTAILSPGNNGAVFYKHPVIEGTAEQGATVVVSNKEGEVCTKTTTADLAWKCDLPEMELEQQADYSVRVTDQYGNVENIPLTVFASKEENVQVVKTIVNGAGGMTFPFVFLLVILLSIRTGRHWFAKKTLLSLAVFSYLSLHSSSALSVDLDSLAESWYIGGGVGASQMNPETEGTDWSVEGETDVSKKVYTGVKVTESLGIEAFWADFGKATLKNGDDEAQIGYSGYGANLIYSPKTFNGNLTPFAKLGVGKFSTKDEGTVKSEQQNDVSIIGGLGADYSLNDQLKIRSEYEFIDKDLSHFNVGLNWSPVLKKKAAPKPVRRMKVPEALPIKPEIKKVYQPVVQPIIQPIVLREPPKPRKIAPAPVYTPPIVQRAKPRPAPRIIHRTLTGGSHFKSGSHRLSMSGQVALDKIIDELKYAGLESKNITITGHTDNVGSAESNLILSHKRAQAVANYMKSRSIPAYIMHVDGKGESRPISSNDFPEGRAKNRRVEVMVSASGKVHY